MASPLPSHEVGAEPSAPTAAAVAARGGWGMGGGLQLVAARGGWAVGGGLLVAALFCLLIVVMQKLIELDYSSGLLVKAGLVAGCGCCLGVVALQQLLAGVEGRRQLQAASAALFPAWAWGRLGGLTGALRRLVDFEDGRLQAAAFLLACGCCTVVNGTVVNPSANWEHVLAGFLLVVVGAAVAVLTLAGAGAGRAAAQIEGFLRRFF